jgi:hypothetical protein
VWKLQEEESTASVDEIELFTEEQHSVLSAGEIQG